MKSDSMDIVSKELRSQIMSGIKGKNTKPELLLRKALFGDGFRYRIHSPLPGKPDIVFPSKKLAIYVHGCFWHMHKCKLDHKPKSNQNFWKEKKLNNLRRDKNNYKKIKDMGWLHHTVWECQIYKDILNEKEIIKKMFRKL